MNVSADPYDLLGVHTLVKLEVNELAQQVDEA